MAHRSFDVLGNIAVVNFHGRTSLKEKKKFAQQLLKEHPNIKTVLEKSGKFSGRLRKMKTSPLAGEKTKEALYKENNCTFRFNVDKAYFSPRLSGERKEIASKIKKFNEVLVMFAGVGPYSCVIAKNSRAGKVYSNEINREANKYALMNIQINHLRGRVELIPGDIKKITEKLKKTKKIFDVVVMPRPRLKETFLKQAFALSKKRTKIFYYDFCRQGEEKNITEKISREAKKAKKKIKILQIKKAGEIAPYKIRVRADLLVEK